MSSDNELRERRLIFYKDDVDRINRTLEDYQKRSKSKCNILVDKEGHCVTQIGKADVNPDTVSALVAGCFTAARELARILGEPEITTLTHQGKTDSIQLTLVGERCILATIFDDATTIGMVSLYVKDTIESLSKAFDDMANRKGEDTPLEAGFGEGAANAIDDLFGE